MEEKICVKTKTPLIYYILLTVSGIVLIVLGLTVNQIIGLAGGIIAIVGAILLIMYLVVPSNPVSLKDDKIIVLNVPYNYRDIRKVSSSNSNFRGVNVDWGTVTIVLRDKTVKFKYVENCQKVCDRLNELKNWR